MSKSIAWRFSPSACSLAFIIAIWYNNCVVGVRGQVYITNLDKSSVRADDFCLLSWLHCNADLHCIQHVVEFIRIPREVDDHIQIPSALDAQGRKCCTKASEAIEHEFIEPFF